MRARLIVLSFALLAVPALATDPAVAAGDTCAGYAAPPSAGGDDANPGTKLAPKANPLRLLEALAPGQTGCLKDGATFDLGGGEAITSTAGTANAPKTLRPETPGARATIRAATGFAFQTASHDLVLRDLDLRDTNAQGQGSLIQLDGDRLTLDGIDATYAGNICLDLGGDPRAGAVDSSDDIVIRNSRIHDCGSAYGPPHFLNDSGVHGIYVQFTRRLVIEDNLIYRNHNRGIQLYPDADDTVVRRNVLYGNGANLNIGSQRDLSVWSERNLVQANIISESVLDGLQPDGFVGDTSEVLGNFPAPGPGIPDFANQVTGNCVANSAHPGELYEGYGFSESDNVENQDPQYANAGAGDFRLAATSPCLGRGPTSIQPLAHRSVTVKAPATAFTGDATSATVKVVNHAAAAAPVTVAVGVAGGKLLGLSGHSGTCTATSCGATLPASGSLTFTARVGITAPGSATTTATVSPADGTPGDDTASAPTTVSGPACTWSGTSAADTFVGGATDEVLCAFGGDDTLTPGAGDDVVNGGAGADRVSYAGATGAAVINLTHQEAFDPGPGTSVGNDTFQGIERGTGTPFADTLVGGPGNDALDGMKGNDAIYGEGGNDTLKGSKGSDQLHGGDGDDLLYGGDGTDTCSQDAGAGSLIGCEL